MTTRTLVTFSLALGLAAFGPVRPASAQINMPDPKAISGVPLPAAELPAGTVSVRVIRGDFSNNIANQPVEIVVDGRRERLRTGEDGRVQLGGLAPGAKVTATTTVAGETIRSQEFAVGASGIRIVLVATDSAMAAREEENRRLAEGPAVEGVVVLGPESRVIAEMQDDRLNIFYVLQILNTARTPVDIGGPLTFELPTGARGTGLMDGSSPQATANGAHVIVTGPFAPGATTVQVGYELPYSGPTAHLRQTWPAALQQLTVLMPKMGGMDFTSSQVQTKREVADQGQMLVVGQGPAIAAGSALQLDITGLPHHPVWPRNLALALAGLITLAGLYAAAMPGRRKAA